MIDIHTQSYFSFFLLLLLECGFNLINHIYIHKCVYIYTFICSRRRAYFTYIYLWKYRDFFYMNVSAPYFFLYIRNYMCVLHTKVSMCVYVYVSRIFNPIISNMFMLLYICGMLWICQFISYTLSVLCAAMHIDATLIFIFSI